MFQGEYLHKDLIVNGNHKSSNSHYLFEISYQKTKWRISIRMVNFLRNSVLSCKRNKTKDKANGSTIIHGIVSR